VYGERLELIRPTRADVDALAGQYRHTLAEGAKKTIAKLRAAGVRLVLVSGGIRRAIEPIATELGFSPSELFAVKVEWNREGNYTGFDKTSPLTTQSGKFETVRGMNLATPSLAVGDGSTDVSMRAAVNEFAAYVGFVRRESVVKRAHHVVETYRDLESLVLASG
jgi:phosphoserine phosphatase